MCVCVSRSCEGNSSRLAARRSVVSRFMEGSLKCDEIALSSGKWSRQSFSIPEMRESDVRRDDRTKVEAMCVCERQREVHALLWARNALIF